MKQAEYLNVSELLEVMRAAKRLGTREHCMFVMTYWHALRRSEVSSLTLADVRNGQIDVRRKKGSLHTVQPLYSHANPLLDEKKALAAWLRERGDADGSQLLFTSREGSGVSARQIYNLFETAAFAAGIDAQRRNVHILKHSFISHLIRAGASVAYVQQAAGHKDPKSTLSYTHISQVEASAVVSSTLNTVFA